MTKFVKYRLVDYVSGTSIEIIPSNNAIIPTLEGLTDVFLSLADGREFFIGTVSDSAVFDANNSIIELTQDQYFTEIQNELARRKSELADKVYVLASSKTQFITSKYHAAEIASGVYKSVEARAVSEVNAVVVASATATALASGAAAALVIANAAAAEPDAIQEVIDAAAAAAILATSTAATAVTAAAAIPENIFELIDVAAPNLSIEASARGISTVELANIISARFAYFTSAEANISGIRGKKCDAIYAITFDQNNPLECFSEFKTVLPVLDNNGQPILNDQGNPFTYGKYDITYGWSF